MNESDVAVFVSKGTEVAAGVGGTAGLDVTGGRNERLGNRLEL